MFRVTSQNTWDEISTAVYGSARFSSEIRQANPGAQILPGLEVVTPDVYSPQQDRDFVDAGPFVFKIDGVEQKNYVSARISLVYDGFSGFSAVMPFDPEDAAQRELYRPLAYKPVTARVGGNLIFRGVSSVSPRLTPTGRTVQVEAYAIPAILFQVMPSVQSYPLSFQALKFSDICTQVCAPFGISVRSESNSEAPIQECSIRENQTVGDFLQSLAKQQGVFLRSNFEGQLVIENGSDTPDASALYEEGDAPLTSIEAELNPSSYFSHVSATAAVALGQLGDPATFENKFLKTILRPYVYVASDAPDGRLDLSVQNNAARMYLGAVAYRAKFSTWTKPDGNIFSPGDVISVRAPGAMIYELFDFQIRSVELELTASRQTATLELTLPGLLSNRTPGALPWGG